MIISEELINKLTLQIRHEIENSQFYSYFQDHLSSVGLENLATYYDNWSKEELKHSELFRKHMVDLDIVPKRLEIPSIDFEITDCKSIVDKTMEREILTTELISEELAISYADGDGISSEFLLMMQKEQKEELNKASTLKKQIYGTKDIYLFDAEYEIED